MNFKRRAALFVAILMVFSVFTASFGAASAEKARIEPLDTDSYYVDNGYSVAALLNKSGSELAGDLTTLMTNTHTHVTSYTEIRDLFVNSDADPANAGKIILCYSGASVNGTWDSGVTFNREHVWPKSRGTFENANAGADLHHIRPENQSVNSIRGNHLMGWIDTATSELSYNNQGIQCYVNTSEDLFEPRDEFKGDVARIYFYVANRWDEDISSPVADTTYQTLLEWNLLDPVDSLESARNEYVYSLQGNRNVFIDYPDFGRLIYKNSANGFDYTLVTSGDYTYYVNDGSAVIASYNGGDSVVTIPSEIDGYTVTALGCAAFAHNSALTSVSIPSSVTKIGTYCFYNDTALRSVYVGSGSKTFARRAFRDCAALTAIYFYGQAPEFENEGADQIMISSSDNGTAPSGLKLYYIDGQSGWTSGTWTASGGTYAYTTATWTEGNEPTEEPATATPDPTATPKPTATPEPGAGSFELVTSLNDVTDGDYVLYGVSGSFTGAMNNVCTSNKMGASAVTISGTTVVSPDASVIWHMEHQEDGSFTLFNEAAGVYCMISSDKTSGFSVGATADYGFTITAADESAGTYYMKTTLTGCDRMISIYQNDFRCYTLSNWKSLYLYKYTEGGEEPTPTPVVTEAPTATPEPGEGEYVLVTSLDDVTSGKYVLYGVNGDYAGAMNSTCNKGRMGASAVAVSGNTIVEPDENVVWLMQQQDDGSFTLYNEAAGVYYMISTDSTGGFSVGETAAYGFTVSAKDEAAGNFYLMTTMEGNSRCISLYQTDFRPYNTGDCKNLFLYKYVGGETPEPTYYTVTFQDYDGTVISTQQVLEGEAATAPADPTRDGYTFTGWDVDYSNVTADLVVTAQYEENAPVVTYPKGDYNRSGDVSATDALLLLRATMNGVEFTAEDIEICDMNGDGRLTGLDALLILRYTMEQDD